MPKIPGISLMVVLDLIDMGGVSTMKSATLTHHEEGTDLWIKPIRSRTVFVNKGMLY